MYPHSAQQQKKREKITFLEQVQYLMPIIPVTQEVKMGKIMGVISLSKKLVRPISTNKSGMVVYRYNPSYARGIHRMIAVQSLPWVKNMSPYLKNNLKAKKEMRERIKW
jgi:hypothetical protein